MLLIAPIYVYADDYSIVITNDNSQAHDNITISASTIDIPIKVSGYQDIYAFSISMRYLPDNVKVESIELGDIFNDNGNAVLVNNMDNVNGEVEFMQTLLGAEKGIVANGTLCTIRITFNAGEYDIINDLNLVVQIANSKPEYMDVYVPSMKVLVSAEKSETETIPTLEPVATATVGIITPDPNSESSHEFVVVEDKDVDEILDEINITEEEESTTAQPSATPTSEVSQVDDDTDNSTRRDEVKVDQSGNNIKRFFSIICIILFIILVIAMLWVILTKVRANREEDEN